MGWRFGPFWATVRLTVNVCDKRRKMDTRNHNNYLINSIVYQSILLMLPLLLPLVLILLLLMLLIPPIHFANRLAVLANLEK